MKFKITPLLIILLATTQSLDGTQYSSVKNFFQRTVPQLFSCIKEPILKTRLIIGTIAVLTIAGLIAYKKCFGSTQKPAMPNNDHIDHQQQEPILIDREIDYANFEMPINSQKGDIVTLINNTNNSRLSFLVGTSGPIKETVSKSQEVVEVELFISETTYYQGFLPIKSLITGNLKNHYKNIYNKYLENPDISNTKELSLFITKIENSVEKVSATESFFQELEKTKSALTEKNLQFKDI